jgi:hypothetical protein
MKPNELIVGGYYVREEKNTILHFYNARSDGEACFHAYNQQDGKYKFSSSCGLGTMMIWADRKATVEEIGKLQPREPSIVEFEWRSSSLRKALRSTSGSRYEY